MIENNIKIIPEYYKTLMNLYDSKFSFYLTGSHFFGNLTKYSDLDLITTYSIEVEKYLESLGFSENNYVQNYLDDMTVKVMSKYFPNDDESYGGCWKIDVQLVRDIENKLKVRNFLKENFSSLPKDKKQTRILWNMVYSYLQDK